MIFGDGDRLIVERFESSLSVQPGGSDEAVDRPPSHIFDERASAADSSQGFGFRETEEFALRGRHEGRTKAVGGSFVPAVIAMEKAVEEHLDAFIGPAAQPRGKARAGD